MWEAFWLELARGVRWFWFELWERPSLEGPDHRVYKMKPRSSWEGSSYYLRPCPLSSLKESCARHRQVGGREWRRNKIGVRWGLHFQRYWEFPALRPWLEERAGVVMGGHLTVWGQHFTSEGVARNNVGPVEKTTEPASLWNGLREILIVTDQSSFPERALLKTS